MKLRIALAALGVTALLKAQTQVDTLPEVTVFSPRVANQTPVATFAMPVSSLRFEPLVDVQARNFAESQADVSIRGGIFENTGFRIGESSLFDPQTGHYFAEIPVAPAMLTAPQVNTGAELAMTATNATSGSVAYGWRPIRTAGAASVGAGEFGLEQAEVYQGYLSDVTLAGQRLGADVAWAHSDSNGSIPFGDHRLNRVDGRLQLAGHGSQTDLFAGYQAKFFGWPNLYTPFGFDETENLKTMLVALNHRTELGGGDYVGFGAYYRRNRDEYILSRQKPAIFTADHTTWVRSAAVDGRTTVADIAWNYRVEALADDLKSTSLLAGRYHDRTIEKFTLVPEKSFPLEGAAKLVVKAGATYDDTNRDGGVVSPVVEVARESSGALTRLYASYAETTQEPTYTALNSSATSGLFRGNASLERERSHNAEVGAKGSFEGWATEAAVFFRRDDGLVDWTFKRGVTARTANPVDIDTKGFEVVTQHAWTRGDVVLGFTWLDKDPNYRGAAVDASFYALNYARERCTAAFTMRLTSELELRMDNQVRVQAANLLRTRGGDRPILSSLGLTYRPVWLHRLALSARVDNLWNSEYQEVPSVPAARRQLSFIASYAW